MPGYLEQHLMTINQIVLLLERQSLLRSLENDLGGCLLQAAIQLRQDYQEVVGQPLDEQSIY